VEAVHFDQSVVVGSSAIDNDEDEVVVDIDLRPLIELLGILDRKRMELEDIAKNAEVLSARTVQVEPEEIVALEETLDRFAVEHHLAAAAAVNDLACRRPFRFSSRCTGGTQAGGGCDRSPRTLRHLGRPTHAGRSNAR